MIVSRDARTLCGTAALLALVQFASLPATPKIFGVLNNLAHAPVFAAVFLLLLAWVKPRTNGRDMLAYTIAFLGTCLAGLGTELLQIRTDRDASLSDVATDALGAGVALCLTVFRELSKPRRAPRFALRLLALSAGIALLLVALRPLGAALRGYAARAAAFPTLMQFESEADLYFVEFRGSETGRVAGPASASGWGEQSALRIRFLGDDWPAVSVYEPSPDWRGYRQLCIDVANPGAIAVSIGIRVDEIGRGQRYDDRFNREFTLAADTRRVIGIPLEDIASSPALGRLDLSRVGALVLFRASPATSRDEIILRRIWLE